MSKPRVVVIACTSFLGVPLELAENGIAGNQDQGSDLARLIETAGRCCYDSYGKGRSSKDYHKHILDVAHGSCAEHSTISFFITNVSRGLTHELVRHRVGVAISQRSTRYVEESESPWIWHPLLSELITLDGYYEQEDTEKIREALELEGKIDACVYHCQEAYNSIVSAITHVLICKGVDKLTARKQARGAARGILGNSLMTELVWTANIRALRHFLEMRASEHADAEIRLLANEIYLAAKEVCPEYFSDYSRVECPDGIGFGLTTEHRKV